MPAAPQTSLVKPVEAARARLAADLLDEEAARLLRDSLAEAELSPGVRAALASVPDLLDGGEPSAADDVPARSVPEIARPLREALVVHPREKLQRHHRLASLLGRVLHMMQGNEMTRTVARVTECATPERFPELCRLAQECADAFSLGPPQIQIARGAERFFLPLMDRQPFLCVHLDYFADRTLADEPSPVRLDAAEARFALAHQLEHVRGGHTALLQISPERLEGLVLDQLPFLFRTPVQLASRAVGWSRANVAARKVGEWLPAKSRGGRVARAMGDLLPDRDQETVLPEVVHEWVRSWIQGVEFSADRAGLLVGGSLPAAASAMLRLSPAYALAAPGCLRAGIRSFLRASDPPDRPTVDRLRELLRFALSRDYLGFLAAHDAEPISPPAEV